MEKFYKISKIDANRIGKVEYANGCTFDPFCSEQVDSTYLVSVELVGELIENDNIKKIDWNKLEIINKSQINNKKLSQF